MLCEIVVLLLCVACYYFIYKPHRFWQERNVRHSKPVIPIVGNFGCLFLQKKAFFDHTVDLYNEYPNERYVGQYHFNTPVLLIRDIDLIKQVCIKDFDHFTDHTLFVDENIDPVFGKSLIALSGERWREMRSTLSPAFTSSKMRAMFIFMSECAKNFTQHFVDKNERLLEIDMKEVFSKFTNDVIASTAFGVKCDTLQDPKNDFYVMGRKVMESSALRDLKMFLFILMPRLMKIFNFTVFPDYLKNFFQKTIKENMKQREEQGIIRPDMVHLLMEARKGKLKHEQTPSNSDTGFATVEESDIGKSTELQKTNLDDDDIVAQALLFFFGGFETSSSAVCFLAHELAVNPDVQIKLQNEIDEVLEKCNNELTHDALLQMKYLDQVVSETLRLWPIGFQLERKCTKPFVIEGSEGSLKIDKGQTIIISSAGIHRDPKYFPDPLKFDPDRFNDENKHKIIPGTYMPFGLGPRNCIGSRFALLEVKTLIFHLLSKFDLVPVEKTSIPLKLTAKKFNLEPVTGFWLGMKFRKSTTL